MKLAAAQQLPGPMGLLAQKLTEDVRGRLDPEKMDTAKFALAWYRVAQPRNRQTFHIKDNRDALIAALETRYRRSVNARAAYQKRDGQARGLAQPILDSDPSLTFKGGARNPMVVSSTPAVFKPDKKETRSHRGQTHLSTVLLQTVGGEEAQASFATDKSHALISTNTNKANTQLAGQAHSVDDLKRMAAELAVGKGIAGMSRKDAMASRVMRHAIKLYARLGEHLDAHAKIEIPGAARHDGQHSETRIHQTPSFRKTPHDAPSGTKYPCMGCRMYFQAQKYVDIGYRMGPMWVTNAALTNQLHALLSDGQTFGKFDGRIGAVSVELAAAYQDLLKSGVKMGHSAVRSGKLTTDTNEDSDSDLDDDEYEEQQKRIVLHAGSAKKKA